MSQKLNNKEGKCFQRAMQYALSEGLDYKEAKEQLVFEFGLAVTERILKDPFFIDWDSYELETDA